LIHAAHQASRLLGRLALKAHARRIEHASPHGLDEIGRTEMAGFAFVGQGDLRGEAKRQAGKDNGEQAATRGERVHAQSG
jgi:hypothetical protein